MFASATNFIALLSLFAIGAVGSLIVRKDNLVANWWSALCASIGAIWGLFFATATLFTGRGLSFSIGTPTFPLLTLSFHIDLLAAFFIFTISLITLFCSIYSIGYVKHFYDKYSIGALGFFYHLFILGMLLVVTTSNGLFFLIAWEIMSVASYFLVTYDKNDQANVKAGFLYLVMTHIGTACIILAFLLLYRFTGSLDFAAIRAGSMLIPLSIKNIVFILAIIGFGTKAGIIPFHIWLPSAHPAAPSHVSGLMSGVMIKTGIYMLIRLLFDILQPIPMWWGSALLLIGSASALLGVLYALTEHDIKRLLAYHSIENIGIILLGLGSALVFYSLGMPSLALLGFTAALFHTLNHAIFKSLLFLSAGSVINETHTRNMEKYGGLIRYMPQTALFFLVGSMAISALPPFNGFFSEWLTFQALFQGINRLGLSSGWVFVVAAGALAFTGGLALACFVKAFGATFLARPRSQEIRHAKESALSLRIGMGALAVLSLLLGVFSGTITSFITKIGHDLAVFHNTLSAVAVSPAQGLNVSNFAAVSAPVLFLAMAGIFAVVILAIRYLVYEKQTIRVGETWDCGTTLTPRMEITATGFAHSIITIFKGILKPSTQYEVEYHDEQSRYLQKTRTVTLSVKDVLQQYFYLPASQLISALSEQVKRIQTGSTNTYILYIFLALLIALASAK